MTCEHCRAIFAGEDGRPDCDSENPQYDGECPRRLNRNKHLTEKRFLLLAGIFTKFHTLPIDGALLDQDVRFLTALTILSNHIASKQEEEAKRMLTEAKSKMPRF